MIPTGPLHIQTEFSDLPSDAAERYEVLVDCFGQYFFWLRNWVREGSRNLIDSEHTRRKLGSIRREPFQTVATMTAENREAALAFAHAVVDEFCRHLIWFLGGRGTDFRLGSRHAYRFHVTMEIVDVETDEVVQTETVSVGGKKFFGDYWGRWLNRFGTK